MNKPVWYYREKYPPRVNAERCGGLLTDNPPLLVWTVDGFRDDIMLIKADAEDDTK